jgi:hypothetical protein
MRTWWLLGLAVAACAASPDVASDDEGDAGGKGDRGGAGFVEVDAAHSTAAFRAYVERAIVVLEHDASQIARLTASAIRAGKVRIDELVDLTCWDYTRALVDLPDAGLDNADYAHLHDRGSPAAKKLTAELDGYMWSNRIYVSRGQTAKALASTLVHETNHVINRSEVGYYDDLPSSAFLHEYRAFHAEAMWNPEARDGAELVDYVIESYALDRAKLRPSVLAHPLTPRMLPDAAAWAARDVRADARDDDATCPAN